MHSKNKRPMTKAERAHVDRVRQLPCSVCGASGPSEAHEPVQGFWFISIALCADCHRGSVNGLHGQRVMWRVHKLDEWGALNITIRRLEEAA
ncbi:hypothetical protein [Marilutibacter spongiae]|uniref:HNH endonuclease n=1 Tax=Marilutibacter spongiae TaxID=2025720 RepID=A0A7W3TLA6_9GAMM|nr:hypothetical protein [Lysobacter spongiae]MBB1060401.1 hypothetical protein [Lysobacter spongiae]